MSSRAAAIKRASSNSESPCKMWSLESGGTRDMVFDVKDRPVKGKFFGERLAIGRIQETKKPGTDFDR